jgi:hypothetical protein
LQSQAMAWHAGQQIFGEKDEVVSTEGQAAGMEWCIWCGEELPEEGYEKWTILCPHVPTGSDTWYLHKKCKAELII